MTLATAILAAHAGRDSVSPGELISVQVDLILANDITAPLAIQEFRRIGLEKVFDPRKIVLVPDHFTPNKDVLAAEQASIMRRFALEQGTQYFEVGRMGIEHVLLPEKGLVLPGDVVIGADSHTCTYGALGAFATGMGSTDIAAAMATGDIWMKVPQTMRFVYSGKLRPWVTGKDLILHTIGQIGVDGARYMAMEFAGEAIAELSMDSRFTMANMAIEAGGKAGLFAVDEKTLEYVRPRAKRQFTVYRGGLDQAYAAVHEYDISSLEPVVACPHSPANVRAASTLASVKIDQAVIGSCTNGRMEDMRLAASVLRGREIHPQVRCIVIPGTQEVYLQSLREGLLDIFIQAGAVVSTPTCGPCLGGYMGILGAGERAVSTTNRNFIGRMGSAQSEIYLSGAPVAAASAIMGRIATPEEAMK